MVVVDRLMKLWHLIALESLDVETVVDAFIKNVFKLYRLPDMIVSDHSSQFVSTFWKTLCTRLKIEARLSTTHHPETDGQTENTNSIMEQYLQMYCLYLQDNWERWLSLAEFSVNNMKNKSISVMLFYATYKQDSQLEFESQIKINDYDLMIK